MAVQVSQATYDLISATQEQFQLQANNHALQRDAEEQLRIDTQAISDDLTATLADLEVL